VSCPNASNSLNTLYTTKHHCTSPSLLPPLVHVLYLTFPFPHELTCIYTLFLLKIMKTVLYMIHKHFLFPLHTLISQPTIITPTCNHTTFHKIIFFLLHHYCLCDTLSFLLYLGFGNPCRYMGKGWKGRGQGMECPTPHKPLPLSEGKGIPSLLPVMFVGVCHITNVLSTKKA